MLFAAGWWRWRDSNPRPKNHSFDFLRAHPQFCSPRWGVRRTTPHWARRIVHDGLCAAHPFMFTANRRPNRSRGTLRQDGCLVKQQEQLYCCRLFLRFGAFKEVLRFRPLIGVQIPRRNPFIPVLCKKKHTRFSVVCQGKRGEWCNFSAIPEITRYSILCWNCHHKGMIAKKAKSPFRFIPSPAYPVRYPVRRSGGRRFRACRRVFYPCKDPPVPLLCRS